MIFPGLTDIEVVEERHTKEKETACLRKYLLGESGVNTCSKRRLSPEERIVEIFCGTRKTRNGPKPSEENVKSAVSAVTRYVKLDEPIRAVTFWGPVKGYSPGIYESPDIGDFLALRRYILLNHAIKQIYEPGIKLTIYPEDTGKIARFSGRGDQFVMALEGSMNEYTIGMENLIKSMGAENDIFWIPESQVYRERNITQNMFDSHVAQNFTTFYDYWIASEGLTEMESQRIPEFDALKELGWKGTIPSSQKEVYVARSLNQGAKDADEAIKDACRYLAAAYTRVQFKLIKPEVSDEKGDIPVLKTTFVPHPKGTPEYLRNCRFDYKVRDTEGKNSETPWAFGVIIKNRDFDAYPILLPTHKAFVYHQNDSLRESNLIVDGVDGTCSINCYKATNL